jgi:hypothetical protein
VGPLESLMKIVLRSFAALNMVAFGDFNAPLTTSLGGNRWTVLCYNSYKILMSSMFSRMAVFVDLLFSIRLI